MLFEDMLRYLERNVPDAKLQTYKEILPFLHQVSPANFEFSLQQFISFNDDNVTIDNIDQFTLFLLDSLIEIIESFGLYISDTESVADKLPLFGKMAIALYRIDNYEDLLAIKYILGTEHDPRETMAELLVLMDNRLTVENILVMVADVSPSLLKRIRELLTDLDYQIQDEPGEDNRAAIEQVKNALVFLGVEKGIRYFKDGGKVGDNVEVILDWFFSENVKRSPEEIAKLVILAGYIATLPTETFKETLCDKVAYYITDVESLLKVTRAINRQALLGEAND